MRVLQVVQGFPPEFIGGTEFYCQVFTRALQERGHRCFVLAGSYQQAREPALVTTDEEGICITRYVSPLSPLWREQQIDPYNPEAELLVRQHLETIHPDVIHVQHWLRLTNNIVSLAAEMGIPAVVTLHDLWTSCARLHRQHKLGHFCQEPPSPSLCQSCVERFPWQGDTEVRRAIELRQEQIAEELRLARCLLVPSETHRQSLSRLLGVSPDRLRVVPHGSIMHLFPHTHNEHPRFPHRPLRLAYWGYLVHHKGVHLLLEAVRQLKNPSAVEVYLTGLAPYAWYFEHLQGLAEGLSVTFAGEYQPTDLARLDVDIAVFPSLAYESYGFVLDEALQLGLPVIVSDRGALAARAGEAGLVFPAGDAGALAHRIQEVLDTPSLLEGMRQKLPSFSSPSMREHARALEAVYQEAGRIPPHLSKASDSGLVPQQPDSAFLTAPRRLASLHTRLAARDQEILHLRRDLQQQGTVLEQREAVIAQQERELRQKEGELRQKKEELSHLARRLQEDSAMTEISPYCLLTLQESDFFDSLLPQTKWTLLEMGADPQFPGNADAGTLSLIRSLVISNNLTTVLQLGTWIGFSAAIIADALERVRQKTGRVTRFDTVDPDVLAHKKARDYVRKAQLSHILRFHDGLSTDLTIVGVLADQYDLIFIDSSHNYRETLNELVSYWPKVRSQGFLLCHDTSEVATAFDPKHEGGPRRALREWIATKPDALSYVFFEPPGWLNPVGCFLAVKAACGQPECQLVLPPDREAGIAQPERESRQNEKVAGPTLTAEEWVYKVSHSVGWRVLQRFYYVREQIIAPPGTRRGKLYDLLKRTGVAYAEGGFTGVIKETRKRLDSATRPDPS